MNLSKIMIRYRSLGGWAFCVGKGGARAAGGGHEAKRSAAQTHMKVLHV
jgi:hypothetical protein